jgi:multisubunit Na+/H+ antiporter MnhB subunit
MSTTILLQAARLLVPLALLVSAFIFVKGHQQPGGGFVGGLVAAVALILYRMCAGGDALQRLLPVRERTLIALGLFLAAATGAAALLARLPFLTSNNGYLPLPDGRALHWATVMVFDAGVFFVVVGVTVGLIDVLARELEMRRQPAP